MEAISVTDNRGSYSVKHKENVGRVRVVTSDSFESSATEKNRSFFSLIFSCFSSLWQALISFFSPKKESYKLPHLDAEVLFPKEKIEIMHREFNRLGEKKWKEVIGTQKHKFFYNESERFIENIEQNGFPLIDKYLGSRLNAAHYLEIHRAAGFELRKEAQAVFRDLESEITTIYELGKDCTEEGLKDFAASGYGSYKAIDKSRYLVTYTPRKKEEIAKEVDRLFNKFYDAMKDHESLNHEHKICHIADLAQGLFFLHPPRDGRKRTTILIIQKLFTEFLGHPGLFKHMHLTMMSCRQLECAFTVGFQEWERYRDSKAQ